MNQLERVARAICVAYGRDPDLSIYGKKDWEIFTEQAQAAIDAMGDGWQPIETAPDDTPVWVNLVECDGDTEQCIAVQFNDEWTDQFRHEIELPVTHWMPLPEPPK
jgi:hypothetical protein